MLTHFVGVCLCCSFSLAFTTVRFLNAARILVTFYGAGDKLFIQVYFWQHPTNFHVRGVKVYHQTSFHLQIAHFRFCSAFKKIVLRTDRRYVRERPGQITDNSDTDHQDMFLKMKDTLNLSICYKQLPLLPFLCLRLPWI